MSAVGLIVALSQESRSLTRHRIKPGQCFKLDHNRLLVVSDTGPEAARRAAVTLLKAGAKSLVSWGCAGGLHPDLQPGDLVIPGQIVQSGGVAIGTDSDWSNRLAERLAHYLSVNTGKLLETAYIISEASEKSRLFGETGAVALDMESASVARVAAELGAPFIAIRSIIDPASVTLPPSIASSFDARGHLQLANLLVKCLFRPSDILDLIQLGRHFKLAMSTLVKVDSLLQHDLLARP